MTLLAGISAALPFSGRQLSVLGDPWLLLTLTAILAAWLFRKHGREAAAAWLLVVLGCIATVVTLKLGGYALLQATGMGGRAFSISGHAAFAACVYGGIVLATVRQVSAAAGAAWLRTPLLLLAAAVAGAALLVTLGVGYSRVAIQAHTTVEVAAGIAVGWSAHLLALGHARRLADRRAGTLLAGFLSIAVLWSVLMLSGQKTELLLKDAGERLGGILSPAAAARGW